MAGSYLTCSILTEQDTQRFWSKLTPLADSECWEWRGPKWKSGYGVFNVQNHTFKAHRISFYLYTGIDPVGLFICHRCDNPPCCNPSHLFAGTAADNMRDRDSKERQAHGNRHGSRTKPENVPRGDKNGSRTKPERLKRGDNHPNRLHPERCVRGEASPISPLTNEQVLTIRAEYAAGTLRSVLAKRFGVTWAAINSIVIRHTWKHI